MNFNFPELCKIAIRLFPEANKVVDCVKKEGGFNRVFVFTLDSGHRVVARLPTRIAGTPRLTTNSEVATIEYCMVSDTFIKTITDIVYSALENINSDPKDFSLERRPIQYSGLGVHYGGTC
jgi:hypothetical protein